MKSSRYYQIKQLSEKWACSKPTIYELINNGQLDAFKIGPATRITSESVQRYEQANRYQSIA